MNEPGMTQLTTRRAEIAGALQEHVAGRQDNALKAALGDRHATRQATRHLAGEAMLAAQLAALDEAIVTAARAREKEEAEAAARQLAERERTLAAQLRRRLVLAGEVENALRRLHAEMLAFDTLSAEIATAEGAPPVLSPLGREALGGRLAEFMAGLGFDAWLPLARPEIRPSIASLGAAEAAAQEAWLATRPGVRP